MSEDRTLVQLPYFTEAQEDYLRDREESKRYCNPFKSYLSQIEKYWTELEQPEASWDLEDLTASGKQFPYPFPVQDKNYLWTMETRYKVLDNTLLVGHQAILHLISAYAFCGAYTFAKWQDTAKCKEYLWLAAYCQESTRYCNYSKGDFGGEITVIKPLYLMEGTPEYESWFKTCAYMEQKYLALIGMGCSPQEARAVLPNSLKTEVVMTANLREWRHFLKLRTANAAHPQMRQLARPLLCTMRELVPVVFDDIAWRDDK